MGKAMSKKVPRSVERYCACFGYSEPFLHEGRWWAYPVGGVMAVPLPLSGVPRSRWVAERSATCAVACLGIALGILIGGDRSWSDCVIAGGFAVTGILFALLGRRHFGRG
jgi:hypothetical protein